MSDYGVLVVESEGGSYQIVAEVASRSEALEMAASYVSDAAAAPDQRSLASRGAFVINRRDAHGWYTVRETLADHEVLNALDARLALGGAR